MYLLDTNVWLERLLNQDKSDEVGRFLDKVYPGELYVTDFTLHSIGIVLSRLERAGVFADFMSDLFIHAGINLVTIQPTETRKLVDLIDEYGLDFDDAYQYLAALQNNLTLVSFDRDFDKTPNGRKTPGELMGERPPSVQ